MEKIIIGVSGCARSGKNLFADIMNDSLKKRNISCRSFALAYYLKKDCEYFIYDKLGLNVWSEKTEDKNIFRDMLVWYGDVKRKQTEGKYWTSLLQKDINESHARVNIVTDIRYSVYPEDEVFWIKNVMNGKLIHISKFEWINDEKKYTEPANGHEAHNNPIVKDQADICVEWPTKINDCGDSYMMLLQDNELNQIVNSIIDGIVI